MQFSVLLLEIFLALGIVSALRCIYAKSEQVQVNMKLYLCHNTWKERELNPYVSSYPRWEPCCHSRSLRVWAEMVHQVQLLQCLLRGGG